MICYLWVSEQTEPGMSGATYAATLDRAPPARRAPVKHNDQLTGETSGLVYEESLYSDWRLLGEVKGKPAYDRYGIQCVIRPNGIWTDLDELAQMRWYSRVA